MTPVGTPNNYQKGAHYRHASFLNSEVVALGPWLLTAKSQHVYRVPLGADPAAILTAGFLRNLTQGDYLVGVFTHPAGSLVLLNNYACDMVAWPTITLAPQVTAAMLLEIDRSSGLAGPLLDDSPLLPGLQLRLSPGTGRLLFLPDKPALMRKDSLF